jgi:hypothetical protein
VKFTRILLDLTTRKPAIKANFPNENVKIGFLHGEAKRQQDQTSQDRIKNN